MRSESEAQDDPLSISLWMCLKYKLMGGDEPDSRQGVGQYMLARLHLLLRSPWLEVAAVPRKPEQQRPPCCNPDRDNKDLEDGLVGAELFGCCCSVVLLLCIGLLFQVVACLE